MQYTERNKEVFEFIRTFQKERGYSPTIREIGEGLYMSPGSVKQHLAKLVQLGMICMQPKKPRTIVIKSYPLINIHL